MGTPYLITPSLPEVLLQAAKIGLPDREGEKFFNHYEAVGWRCGRNRICSWTHALAGWKMRWQEMGGTVKAVKSAMDKDLEQLLREARRYAS